MGVWCDFLCLGPPCSGSCSQGASLVATAAWLRFAVGVIWGVPLGKGLVLGLCPLGLRPGTISWKVFNSYFFRLKKCHKIL